MKRIALLFLTFSLLLSPSLVFGRSAADVIFYHYRATPHSNNAFQENESPFPLFPQEQSISNFPIPVSKNETNLSVLHRYYENVAKAYGDYLKENLKPKLTTYKLQMAGQQQRIHLTQARQHTGKNQFARHLTEGRGATTGQDRTEQKARVQAIGYYNATFRELTKKLVLTEKKAHFYQELAKISEDLYKGEIH